MPYIIGSLAVLMVAIIFMPTDTKTVDQCLRAEIFKACMAPVASDPSVNKNNLPEIIRACDGAAYAQALRLVVQVKPECRK